MLLISFAMLSHAAHPATDHPVCVQGAILFFSTILVAHEARLTELYFSAALTLILKVITSAAGSFTSLIRRLGA